MGTIKQSEFDELVTHTIRIELKEGTLVQYRLSVEAKQTLWSCLANAHDSEYNTPFIWLYIEGDRLVFINRKEVVRLTFCFDAGVGEESFYYDNFNDIGDDLFDDDEDEENDAKMKEGESTIVENLEANDAVEEKHENKWKTAKQVEYLSQLVIKHAGKDTGGYFGNPSFYNSLNEGDIDGLEFDFEERVCMVSDFINFIDDDGEENFIPKENLVLVEIERRLLLNEAQIDLLVEKKAKQPSKKTTTNK